MDKNYQMDKTTLEAMLAEQFGGKLEPIKEKLSKKQKHQQTYIEQSREKAKQKARERRGTMLLPEHLRADRLRDLVDHGKTKYEIKRLYHFEDMKEFYRRVKELGCGDLFPMERPKQVV